VSGGPRTAALRAIGIGVSTSETWFKRRAGKENTFQLIHFKALRGRPASNVIERAWAWTKTLISIEFLKTPL